MKAETKPQKIWSPAVAIFGTIAIYLGAQIIGGLVVSIYPAVKRWSEATTSSWFNTSIWAQFFLIAVIEIVTILLLKQVLKRYKASLKTLGLRWPDTRDLLYSAGAFLPYLLVTGIVIVLIESTIPGVKLNQVQEIGFKGASGASLVLVFGSLVILPAIVEELLIRGFLYTGIKSKLPIPKAAIITSLIFAAAHLQFGGGKSLVWSAAVDTFILSLVLIYLREKTGGLAAPICLHLIKNSAAFISLFIITR